MANSNVTVVHSQSQFKDCISAKERLLNCGVRRDRKNPVNQYRSAKKNGDVIRRYFLQSKTALI